MMTDRRRRSRIVQSRRIGGVALLLASLGLTGAAAGEDTAAGGAVTPRERLVPGALELLGDRTQPPMAGAAAFLPPDAAFVLTAMVQDASTIIARWTLADTYYLYHGRFSFAARAPDGVALGTPRLPEGKTKDDEYFGRVRVHYGTVEAAVPILRRPPGAADLVVEIGFQGCTDLGLCYPPMTQTVSLRLPAR